jgi:LmbE family N-acetylglucosaminyl deacetylase
VTTLLLAPHNDDEALFASYLLLRHRPHVVVCLRSHVQEQRGYGITALEREAETDCALTKLGVGWEQWPYLDSRPDWAAIRKRIRELAAGYDHVFAPAPEQDGHEQHTRIGEIASEVCGGKVTHYLTYTRGGGRSTWGVPVQAAPGWDWVKRDALACYESQAAHPSTAAHFTGPIGEYVAP